MRVPLHITALMTALLALPSSGQNRSQAPSGVAATNTAAQDERRFRETLAVQTVLDRNNLSGGRIDGLVGSRTRGAIEVWQANHDLTPSGRLTDVTRASILAEATNVFTTCTVTREDHAELCDIPATWAGKAEMARLGYQTILEMLAERYHASERAIKVLNPEAAWPDPPAGSEIVVPNPFPAVKASVERLAISLSGKWVRAYDGQGRVVAHFPCSIAANKSKRPVGDLVVVVAASEPNYTFNPEVFPEDPESQSLQGRKLIIPPGPNNPVGSAWIGLNLTGYGMHGTPHPEDIGKTESHGCFRLANWNAMKLLQMVRAGLPVTVEE